MIFPKKDDSLILMVDFQNGFLKVFKEKIRISLENNMQLLIETAKFYEIPVVVMEQNNEKLGNTTENIQKTLGELYKPCNKFFFSGWKDKTIRTLLQDSKKNNIILCGIETHICVLQTAIDLIENGFNVYAVSDTIGSRFKKDWNAGLNKLKDINVNMLTVEMLLFAFLERSDTKDFKHFLRFLK